MKLSFLGTPAAAVPALASLLEAGHDVRLVITQPDRPAGRSGRAVPPAVKSHALEHGLAVEQPVKVRTQEFQDRIAREAPDALVVVAYGRILPKNVLSIARLGAVNLHFSLLPKGRGAAPVQWTLARGEETTGVTTMQIDEKLDEGDILLQRELAIEPGEHTPQLQDRLARLGAALLVDTLARLERGDLAPRPQDHAKATYAPPLRKEDGHADFGWPAREVEGRVRGFDPWPGVWARGGERRMRIVRARADQSTTPSPPGSVLDLDRDDLRVACGGGTVLRVASIQLEGRRPVTAREAVQGRLLAPGDRLEGPAVGA